MRTCTFVVILSACCASPVFAAEAISPESTAAALDQLILSDSETDLQLVDDATFLRRATIDIAGRPPTPAEITQFGLNPSAGKRQVAIAELLDSDDYSVAWSRYWRDAIFHRATNIRANLVRPAFERWMAESLQDNRSWDAIVTDLLTATGSVNDNGQTALFFAHEGEPEEVAAEASRLFLGIQIQCANCHDHPWDEWKREQFHEFAAFFPRVSVRRDRSADERYKYEIVSVDRDRSSRPGVTEFLLTRVDRNSDGFVTEAEAKNTPLRRAFRAQVKATIDKNGDGRLSLEEIRTAKPPNNNRPGRGATEHYMADLSDPGSKGQLIHPAFFVHDASVPKSASDASRRGHAARLITSKSNSWFAKAIVNRLWTELTGAAFCLPVDDLGPGRSVEHEEALQLLADRFTANGYDLKWLITTITSTQLYQRALNAEADGFAALEPSRLRADQFYDALCQTLNVTALPLRYTGRRAPNSRNQDQGRMQFAVTFGFDPSVPRNDLTGSIPESLFMMNSPEIHNFVKADSENSTVARISRRVLADDDVVRELYLTTLSREPTEKETKICIDYVNASSSRKEGFEDVLWSLLNSTEFQSKR